ncbi:MAG: DUF2339 domain-containing protein [Deltaproteobacteria bacterium]|nr:DUF2339 domain-containing protein [Deltaproteobacteria bacterium]
MLTVRRDATFDAGQKIQEYVKNFFTTGNVVVRVGLIVLFFGVAFLLKYAASRGLVPIELRLCGVAAGGVALLVLGWRLRMKKEAYALLLQGGGIGVLYLTVFGAVRLYELIPPVLALVLMVAFIALAGMLAIVQNARSLALFGACGGFLAPVLVSTGSGSHVLLFSYYALLNAGVLGTAWYKAWRELNLTGFIFTFGIGALWGASYYRPAHFATVEPFLILFFLMYAAISILFALRQPPRLKGVVDGSLVFGLPLVAFGLQSALVRNFEYGLAMSACALAAFYIVTATVLWKKQAEGLRLLTESFLALGVVFGSLAIPLALDSFWTAGSWALEGAALVWIGLRQRRCLARSFGLLLQLGAGVALCFGLFADPPADTPVVNAFYLGCLLVSLAAFFSNYCHCMYRDRLMTWERTLHGFIMVWALLWWFGGGLAEIGRHAATGHGIFAALVFLSLSACALSWLNRKLAWEDCLFIPCGLLPALIPLAAATFYLSAYEHPCARWGLAAWLLALGINYYLLKIHEQAWPKNLVGSFHVVSLLLATALLAFEAAYWSNQALREAETWQFVTWCIVPGCVVAALYAWGRRLTWPIQRWSREYLCAGTGILAGFLAGWIVAGCLHKGSPAPLPYLPLINPLELVQIAAFLVIGKWYKENRAEAAPYRSVFFSVFAAGVFVWLNSVLARATHFWAKVPFDGSHIWDAPVFQTSASILWTLSALGAMTFAVRIQSRRVWFTGAGLAGIVVIKLFTVDLAGIGTVARIISFIGVGVLLLVVGYFSPLPPRRSMEDTQ